MTKMDIVKKILHLDRRIIFLTLFIVLLITPFIHLDMKINITNPTLRIFNDVEGMIEGDPIIVSMSYAPFAKPELYPMTMAFLRHCCMKKLRIIFVATNEAGLGIAIQAMEEIKKEFQYEYGKDYVLLAFNPVLSAVMLGMGESIKDIFPEDYYGDKIKGLKVLKDVNDYRDIKLLMDFSAGDSPVWWVVYANTRYNQRIGTGVTAVMAADFYPYLNTGQMIGLINGLKGAAEYETLINMPADATEKMTSQAIAHIVIIIFILIGNIAYFIDKRNKKKERHGTA